VVVVEVGNLHRDGDDGCGDDEGLVESGAGVDEGVDDDYVCDGGAGVEVALSSVDTPNIVP